MNWRLAKSLETLREQINDAYPHRSKESDGAVGDAAHASRSSDHNPWIVDPDGGPNVVSAIDVTNDPINGLPSEQLAELLLKSRDPRIKYVISNKKIASGVGEGHAPWVWRPYSGTNPHNHHVHISVQEQKSKYDDTSSWNLDGVRAPAVPAPAKPAPAPRPILRKGSKGDAVEELQRLLGFTDRAVDGDFGPKTEAAVEAKQREGKIMADGVVGRYTWDLLVPQS